MSQAYQLAVTLYVYRWNRPPENPRKGKLCRILTRGAKNSCLIEFVDGFRMLTSRNAIKKYRGQRP
jgi:hypothetical protein